MRCSGTLGLCGRPRNGLNSIYSKTYYHIIIVLRKYLFFERSSKARSRRIRKPCATHVAEAGARGGWWADAGRNGARRILAQGRRDAEKGQRGANTRRDRTAPSRYRAPPAIRGTHRPFRPATHSLHVSLGASARACRPRPPAPARRIGKPASPWPSKISPIRQEFGSRPFGNYSGVPRQGEATNEPALSVAQTSKSAVHGAISPT